MAAIMQWKSWNREKSYFMFLNLAKFIHSEDEMCQEFSKNLEAVGINVFLNKSIPLDEKIIQTVWSLRDKVFGKFDEKKETELLSNTACSNYVNKAVRELNLEYVSRANKKYEQDHRGEHSATAKELFDKGYIKYLPIDFQQYKTYGIIYEYDSDIQNYDYKMGNY